MDACTQDYCDMATGMVTHLPLPEINDNNPCTGTETCQGSPGQCQPGTPVDCADTNACTDDTCSVVAGQPECKNTSMAGCIPCTGTDATPCNDGSACTTDACTLGRCSNTKENPECCEQAGECDDGNPCTDNKCNGAGICVPVNNAAPCDDGQFCTSNDRCQNRVCQGTMMNCSSLNDGCHIGVCSEVTQGCVAQAVANGAPCDDGNACTLQDTCQSGVCVGSNPVVCTALDQCHNVGVCDPTTGV